MQVFGSVFLPAPAQLARQLIWQLIWQMIWQLARQLIWHLAGRRLFRLARSPAGGTGPAQPGRRANRRQAGAGQVIKQDQSEKSNQNQQENSFRSGFLHLPTPPCPDAGNRNAGAV